MTNPSNLGMAIEGAFRRDARFQQHREPIQYLCCYKTRLGAVFAFERVTLDHITLWLPEDERVRSVAEKEGLSVVKSAPYSDPSNPDRYGRISSLQPIPELRDASLYRIAVN